MQTFLPYPDFSESARVLDAARLGKQRVEALQVLRAIVLPAYGWQSHPAMQMWRGYVPELTRYALAMVDEWTARGNADSTRPLITEFAPEAATAGVAVPVPSWLGHDALHLSHRSNLVRKAPEFYSSLFPGVPDDLPYVWPGADPGVSGRSVGAAGEMAGETRSPMWILRPRTGSEFEEWMSEGVVSLRALSPRGKRTAKWKTQVDAFARLEPGTPVAVLTVDGERLVRGIVGSSVVTAADADGELVSRLAVDFGGELLRRSFRYPALLQDPRTVFSV